MLFVAVAVLIVSLGTTYGLIRVHRNARFETWLGDNEVPGILFGALAALYGALLAFVVFATWESYARAEDAVTNEAADLIAAYRDTQSFPDRLRIQAQFRLRSYARIPRRPRSVVCQRGRVACQAGERAAEGSGAAVASRPAGPALTSLEHSPACCPNRVPGNMPRC